MTKAETTKARKADIAARGYSAGVAGAIAAVDFAYERELLLKRVGELGVTDGVPRTYLAKLLGHALGVLPYPTAPKALSAIDTRYINSIVDRVGPELVETRRRAVEAADAARA